MSPRVVSVKEAVAAIVDGATVVTDGFTMMGVAEAVFAGIEDSFLQTDHPRDLVVVHASGQSNRHLGFEHFANKGLVRRIVGSHWGLMPRMSAFLGQDQAEAVCLPQGQISTLLRAIAAGRPGNLSRIGRGTFVDPRLGGGKMNPSAVAEAPDYVSLVPIDGQDYLLYKAFPVDVGIIRATSVDEDGNCSQEEEAVVLDALAIAQAAHNSGGVVICQTKRLVPRGSIPPKQVAVPGCLIDFVVVATDPERQHRQTDAAAFDPVYVSPSGGGKRENAAPVTIEPEPQDARRLMIGRSAVRFLHRGDVVNVGTGIPGDTVAKSLVELGLIDSVVMTVESGVYGGIAAGGIDFGIAAHPSAIIPHPAQFDFYDGGGVDTTFMGAGQVDASGNVNVSRLGGRVVGCGGFIDIVQSARQVCFCFPFESKFPKFVDRVDHLTFSAQEALRQGQDVLYITERAVFRLESGGLRLIEVAPDVDVQRDVLDLLPFPVLVDEPVARAPVDLLSGGAPNHELKPPRVRSTT